MGLMEPSDTFTLTLRGYQKQALLSVAIFYDFFVLINKLQVDAFTRIRQDGCTRVHFDAPLMEPVRNMVNFTFLTLNSLRYVFPEEPVFIDGEPIDLTTDEKPFYMNPYSGEMSLDFPKAERKCRGGILAYALFISFHSRNCSYFALQ